MNVDFVRELELCDKDGDDDRRVVRIDTSLDVGAMPFRQRMTWNFFDRQPKTNFMTKIMTMIKKFPKMLKSVSSLHLLWFYCLKWYVLHGERHLSKPLQLWRHIHTW